MADNSLSTKNSPWKLVTIQTKKETELKKLTRIAAAAGAAFLGLGLSANAALALPAPADPTIDNIGGIEAPSSPGGIPANGYGPDYHTAMVGLGQAALHPGMTPLGANDFNCLPAPGTEPVVLIPGTSNDAFGAWSYMSPRLKQAGYCVFTLNYNPATSKNSKGETIINDSKAFSGDIKQSAAFMAGFVDRVLAATGATTGDLVGHSQGGGALPRAYIKWYGGDQKVDQLIGLTPNNHGTTLGGMLNLVNWLRQEIPTLDDKVFHSSNQTGLMQQLVGSEFFNQLNDGIEVYPNIDYTVITTKLDTVVTPYTSEFLEGSNVNNVVLQDVCPADTHRHQNMTYSDVALQLVLQELQEDRLSWQIPVQCQRSQPYLKASDL